MRLITKLGRHRKVAHFMSTDRALRIEKQLKSCALLLILFKILFLEIKYLITPIV